MAEIHCKSLYTDKKKPWRFELLEPVRVTLSDGKKIVIPKGFKTDFASVPRMLRGFVWGVGNHNLASLIHDFLYDHQIGTRKAADKEMLHWMKKAGCSKVKMYTIYTAIRIGGKSWWDS